MSNFFKTIKIKTMNFELPKKLFENVANTRCKSLQN